MTQPRPAPGGHVVAVSRSATHTFSKPLEKAVRLLPGLGVDGDVAPGDLIRVGLPPAPYRALIPV